MKYPTIYRLATTYKVVFPDGKETVCGTLTRAVEVAQENSDTITFEPYTKIEKAPYTGSMENDALAKR